MTEAKKDFEKLQLEENVYHPTHSSGVNTGQKTVRMAVGLFALMALVGSAGYYMGKHVDSLPMEEFHDLMEELEDLHFEPEIACDTGNGMEICKVSNPKAKAVACRVIFGENKLAQCHEAEKGLIASFCRDDCILEKVGQNATHCCCTTPMCNSMAELKKHNPKQF